MVASKRLAAACAALLLACVTRAAPADSPVSPGFPYGSQKVRGVNLGGWLVLEVRRLSVLRNVLCAPETRPSFRASLHTNVIVHSVPRSHLPLPAMDHAKPLRQHGQPEHRRRVDLWADAGPWHGNVRSPAALEYLDHRVRHCCHRCCWVSHVSLLFDRTLTMLWWCTTFV